MACAWTHPVIRVNTRRSPAEQIVHREGGWEYSRQGLNCIKGHKHNPKITDISVPSLGLSHYFSSAASNLISLCFKVNLFLLEVFSCQLLGCHYVSRSRRDNPTSVTR